MNCVHTVPGMGFLYTDDGGAELYEDDSDYGADPFGHVGGGGYYSDGLNFDELYGGGAEMPSSLPIFDDAPWYVSPDYSPTDPIRDFRGWEGFIDYLAPAQENIVTDAPHIFPNVGNWPQIPFTPITPIFPDIWNTLIPWEPPVISEPPLPPEPPQQRRGPCPVTPTNPFGLPPACYGPTYHPIDNPCICVPYPTTPQTPRPQQTGQPGQPQQPPRPPQQPPVQQGCPPGQWLNPQTRRCETTPNCPPPTVFDPRTGRCALASQVTQPPDGESADEKNNWWWLLLAGAAVVVLSDSGSSPARKGGRRR